MIGLFAACAPPPACPPHPWPRGRSGSGRWPAPPISPPGITWPPGWGDYVLENAESRWVVRTGDEGHALLGLTGGNLVDAVRIEGGDQVGEDGLREYALAAGFHMAAAHRLRPGPDRLRVDGELVPFDLVLDLLPTPRPTATVSWEYVLAPHGPILEIRSLVSGGRRPWRICPWSAGVCSCSSPAPIPGIYRW